MLEDREPRVPAGTRVYAIGDIHGRLDILQEIQERIIEDYAASGRGLDPLVVYLGDYVDRGFQSRELLDHFVFADALPMPEVFLLGNHDQWLMRFLEGDDVAQSWLRFGGDATLLSYGVRNDMKKEMSERIKEARVQLNEKLASEHRQFLDSLESGFSFGDYFFCHAGIRPDLPLQEQHENDLLWMREPFLSADVDYGKIIVHGHTVEETPILRRNRIGIDTGACYTGILTSLVLEGDDIRFLSTALEEPVF